MLFTVPQYIDVEDKVVGPLTVKQLLWMIAAGVLTLIMWAILPKVLFFIIAIPELLIFGALAFYRPYGQPLVGFVISGIFFLFGPKIYVWKRDIQKGNIGKTSNNNKAKEIDNRKILEQERRRKFALNNLSGIAKILDSDGEQSDQGVVEMLKRSGIKK